ncbi:neurogenic locus notch homolog protein 1-like [Bradysia coprophila]|uniref:neurogenic locus notch homolog protein 1-like n=1 Tax=Bradysia coprophila TaxID=38358 RepID=UPI00187D75B9|nr:neurogenic locus notch homolog protein 1-like [Bradysia coprophila]
MAKPENIPKWLLMLILVVGILRIAASESVCTPACRNGGTCIFHNICRCPSNFAGKQCQYSVDRCAPQKIGFNGSVRCIGTSTSMNCTLSCPSGVDFDSPPAPVYTCSFETGLFTPSRAPKCNYGSGVEVIRRIVGGNDQVTCHPSCKNGGTCIFRDVCQCTKDYVGPQCQYSIDRCAPQKIGFNGAIKCTYGSTEMRCTLSCPPGVEFDSQPSGVYVCKYETGTYLPARVPKCVYDEGVEVIQRTAVGRTFTGNSGGADQATCSPRCMNGGSCIFHNLCQCTKNYRGPQCQYSAERCSITRTGFNGGYRCSSSSTESNCTIYCPDGTDYQFSPAATYRCRYETGRFEPSAIPKCIAAEGVQIVRVAST